jgi:polyphosphate:AMP phosphotransferase
MVEIQNLIREAKLPVVVMFCGVDGAGKHESVDLFNEWMDPRWISTLAYGEETEEEKLRPEMWKYWKDLPGSGQMGLFINAWATVPLLKRVNGDLNKTAYKKQLKRVAAFEKTLQDNGYLVLKYWMHLSKSKQEKRLMKLSSDELSSWQIRASDWENYEMYDRYMDAANDLIDQTDAIPWTVIDGSKEKSRFLQMSENFIAQVESKLDVLKEKKKRVTCLKSIGKKKGLMDKCDLSKSVERDIYKSELKRLQSKVNKLQYEAHRRKIPTVLVFEGWDAAGKGGAIRRLTKALDSRQYSVIPIAAPTQEELGHHYLWRFWKQLPRGGRLAIFDRSWYGRVLVERVEGFAEKKDWHQAFEEIRDFESELVSYGTVVCKFWLHVSQDEQLRRFEERAKIDYKAWKLNDEDWRNREKWDLYLDAAEDMFQLTEQPKASWSLIPSNDKPFARLKVLSTVCKALEDRLEQDWDPDPRS